MVSAASTDQAQPPDYSAEERERLAASFQVELAEYQTKRRYMLLWLGLAIGSAVLAVQIQDSSLAWIPGVAVVPFLILFVRQMLRVIDKLRCPGCGERQYQALGPFCPACGRKDVESPRKWFQVPQCRSCGTEVVYRKHGPRFRRRFCSMCGLKLDDEGFTI